MKTFRKWLQIIGLLIGAGILIYQIKSGIFTLQQKNLQFSFSIQLLFAFVFVFAAYAFQMFAWSDAMKSINVYLHPLDVVRGYLLSFLPRYIPGTIWGYISRSEWLYQQYGVEHITSYQGSVVETLAAIVANIILIANFTNRSTSNKYLLIPVLSILLPFLLWYLFRLISQISLTKFPHLNSVIHFLFPLINLRYWLSSIIWFLLVWGFYGLGLMFLSTIFDMKTNNPSLVNWMAFSCIYAIAWFIGFVILFAPAGLGFREFALTNLLTSQLSIGFGFGSILAILFRLIMLASELLWLGVGLLLRNRSFTKSIKSA